MPGYTVAQHCVEGASRLAWPWRLPFLLHELGEVYLPDIQTPYKHLLRFSIDEGFLDWAALEGIHEAIILEALGLSEIHPLLHAPQVKAMDLAMLALEKQTLMGPSPEEWSLGVEPARGKLKVWTQDKAEYEFISMYHRLLEPGPLVLP